MNWRSLDNFSTNSLCLVLSSRKYNPDDYIEDFDEFLHELTNAEINRIESVIPNFIIDNKIFVSEIFYKSTVNSCKEYKLPQVHNPAGNLTSLNNNDDIPFEIKRAYYLYDVPTGAERGGHAHKDLHQFIVAASGSFDVIIDDGTIRKTISLNRPDKALLIVPGIWREVVNFSGGAICMVLASGVYVL